MDRILNEPALVIAVVIAATGLLSAFGLGVSDEQAAAIVAFVGSVLTLAGALVVRAQVTPTRKIDQG